VVLQADAAAQRFAEAGDAREFARGHARSPFRTGDFAREHAHVVEPVLEVIAARDDSRAIEFAGGREVLFLRFV
jgi:hypothetical protein